MDVADLCEKFNLDLDDVAVANLDNAKDRWRETTDLRPFDEEFPEHERPPQRATIPFQPRALDNGLVASVMTWDGQTLGDPLTDTARIQDGRGLSGRVRTNPGRGARPGADTDEPVCGRFA